MSRVGKALRSPRTLTTYKVQVKDDQIMIEV
jgi:nitrite reductase/ring-hydroxylating ferredoxin subunit